MSKHQIVKASSATMHEIANTINQRYTAAGYCSQVVHRVENGENIIAVQIKNTKSTVAGNLKKVAGISTCVELKMVERSGYVNIEVGKGSWLYKGVLLFVGIFITAGGLAVLGGIGAYNQKQLIDKVFTDTMIEFATHNQDRHGG